MVIGLFLLSACSPAAPASTSTPTLKEQLTPYSTLTPSSTPLPATPAPSTPIPSPSPTPRTHTVQAGEDMGGIASRYHVSLQALMQANPKVTPNAMSVGTLLIIPDSANGPVQPASLPTPVSVTLGLPRCTITAEGGLQCFILVKNTQKFAVENVGALLRVSGASDSQPVSLNALPPLNLIPAGASLPLLAYFPPPVPQPFLPEARLLSALPVPKDDARYLQLKIDNQQVAVLSDGLSAEISAEVSLAQPGAKASQVWAAAIAYDETGNVIGARSWESKLPLSSGQKMPFALRVYAQEGKINHVEVFVEARP